MMDAPVAGDQATQLQIEVITAAIEGGRVNAVLITGREDAILIDAHFRLSDAHRLVAAILESRKNLTTVYITHSHPDHYFGLEVVKQAFPSAKILALPATIARINLSRAGKILEAKALFGNNVTSHPVIPEALEGSTIFLEGEKLEVTGGLQGDEAENSYVWIPSLKALVCGDLAYSGVYPWTPETTPEERKDWIAVLDQIAELQPSIVVAGHKNPNIEDDMSSIQFTKDYLTFFDSVLSDAKNPDELQTTIRGKFPGLEVDIVLKIGAGAAFASK